MLDRICSGPKMSQNSGVRRFGVVELVEQLRIGLVQQLLRIAVEAVSKALHRISVLRDRLGREAALLLGEELRERGWWGSPLVRCCYTPSVPQARRTAWMSRRSNRHTSSSSLTVTCHGSTLRTEPRRARDQGSARPGADPTTRSTGTPASWAP